MTDPNIIPMDEEGNKITDSNVLVNGTLPGDGGADSLSELGDVDVTAMLEGSITDRPAAGTAGRWYHAIDQSIMYRDDGSSWTAIAGTGQAGERIPNTSYFDSVDANNVSSASLSIGDGTIGGSAFARTLDADDGPTAHIDSLVTVSFDSSVTIFNRSQETYLLGGVVIGMHVGFRLTVDGTVVIDQGTRVAARDGAGDQFSTAHIPSAKADSSMKLEAKNNHGTSDQEMGWQAYTL